MELRWIEAKEEEGEKKSSVSVWGNLESLRLFGFGACDGTSAHLLTPHVLGIGLLSTPKAHASQAAFLLASFWPFPHSARLPPHFGSAVQREASSVTLRFSVPTWALRGTGGN